MLERRERWNNKEGLLLFCFCFLEGHCRGEGRVWGDWEVRGIRVKFPKNQYRNVKFKKNDTHEHLKQVSGDNPSRRVTCGPWVGTAQKRWQ